MNANPALVLDDVIQKAVEILKTVEDVGQVHAYIRFNNTDAGIAEMMLDPNMDTTPKRIRFWTVTRTATASNEKNVHAEIDTHTITLRGWASLVDAQQTERDFQNLVERVRAKFRPKKTLDGAVFQAYPMQAPVVMSGAIAGFLVHYCELTLRVDVYPMTY